MGGAEGTKLDLDFMEMERVSSFTTKDLKKISSLIPIPENRRNG